MAPQRFHLSAPIHHHLSALKELNAFEFDVFLLNNRLLPTRHLIHARSNACTRHRTKNLVNRRFVPRRFFYETNNVRYLK